MKSKSRLPKFRDLEPLPGQPIVQSDPLIWTPNLHGLPCWFKPFGKSTVIRPVFSPAVQEHMRRQGLDGGAFAVQPSQWTIVELRARQNPWHPAGRVNTLKLRRNDGWRTLTLLLKFSLDDAIQCLSVQVETAAAPAPVQKVRDSKYKGPRLSGDTRSGVVSVKAKRP